MTALRVVRTAMVGVVLVLTLGSGIAAAQTTPTLKTDVQLYDLGDTVTYTGTGFCVATTSRSR